MSLSAELFKIIEQERLERGDHPNTINFVRLSPTAKCPRYANDFAVGMDLFADEAAIIEIGERRLITMNIAIQLPSHLEAQVRPRSGLAMKAGITVLNSPGTIDPDYRGSLGVILYNAGHETFEVRHGDRIAQLVIAPFIRAPMFEVRTLDTSDRGENGFGSTGVR